jgi:hypothetical protein
MGMVACFAGATAATIDALKSDPSGMQGYLYPEDGDGEPPHYVDVDKSWHCIHFMLAGDAGMGPDPSSWAFFAGEVVGEDVGYGPARILQPAQVQSIASALSSIGLSDFKARYSPSAMQAANVYLSDMCVRDGDEALDYIAGNYQTLVAFYRGAAERGEGAVLWVS